MVCHLWSPTSQYCSTPTYVDGLPASTDHWLVNRKGQSPVSYRACTGSLEKGKAHTELGFRTFYHNTGSKTDGLASGAHIGVIGDTTTKMHGDGRQGGPAPHGNQYYTLEDTDGFVFV